MSPNSRTRNAGDILVDSDWITTILMGLAFVYCIFTLGWDIRNLLFDRLDHPISIFYFSINAIYSFLFAYWFRANYVRVAFILLGAQYSIRLVLAYFDHAKRFQHTSAEAGSIVKQIAFVIILTSIIQWFRSVIRRVPPDESAIGNS